MQGIGFVDEVDQADVDKMVDAAKARLAHSAPFVIGLGPTVVDPEVVRLQVTPADPVRELRGTLRAAIADVWGKDAVPDSADDFTPHVSLAYSNRVGAMAPVFAAATATSPHPADVTIAHADLILLNRDHKQYQWTTHARVLLGG